MKSTFYIVLVFAITAAAFFLGSTFEQVFGDERIGGRDRSFVTMQDDNVAETDDEDEENQEENTSDEEEQEDVVESYDYPAPRLHNIREEHVVTFPLTVRGTVPGEWFAVNNIQVSIEDDQGNELGKTTATAQETSYAPDDAVFFEGVFGELYVPQETNGFLVLTALGETADAQNPYQVPIVVKSKDVDTIIVLSPLPRQVVSSPLQLRGEAVGWFHEGEFSVRLLDEDGNEITRTNVVTQDDWLSLDYLEFEGTLEFDDVPSQSGSVVFKSAAAAPGQQQEIVIPVQF
jgi:hypothetical protein